MMDTKKVMEFVDSLNKKEDDPKPAEDAKTTEAPAKAEEVKEEPKAEETATAAAEPTDQPEPEKKEPVAEPAKEDEPPAREEESKTEDKPVQQHTRQEQIDYAFKKEKAKRKALEAKYAQLQKKFEALQAKKPEDPKDQDAVIDYKVNLKDMQHEMERTQEAIQESEYQEYNELNNARINACFPDPEEQRKFREVISAEGPKLLQKLEANDPENAVLGYLDDSDLAPILTRLMIAEPKYLEDVLSKRSPYGKYEAMRELEKKVEYARNELAKGAKGGKAEPAPQPKPKPAIPVVGSVTKSESTKETKQVFDPNAYLHKLNSRNTYHSRAVNSK